ncbi:MAG: oligoendopeptidase F [Candidatus Epulonipiscioides saccharophilum]|nr:MAG: oligoendopeptidase F [Epulopiscium sp. AS2M-Bin001]
MTFNEFKYERPDFDQYKKEISSLVNQIESSNQPSAQIESIKQVWAKQSDLATQAELAAIRYSINTEDKFYEKESEYWDEFGPLYQEIELDFKKALVKSKFRKDLEKEFGTHYFNLLENGLKVFSPDVIEECQEENKLITEYNKLMASAKIEYNGTTYNLAGLGPFKISTDRSVRKESSELANDFFATNKNKFEDIFDKLVKLRDKKAKKLGFENYIEFGYVNMNRTDYDQNMVANFRKQILEYLVPTATKLYQRQKERLGLSELYYYDEKFEFNSGNAKPHGDAHFIVQNAQKMYNELSPETKEFFEFMVNSQLLDLETAPAKQPGGYCTYINNYKAPFIFSNFNGTAGDVDVLTHEVGHAFQVYQSRYIEIPDLMFPTCESCEIHSMSMEFITFPWMNLFFKEEADKYKFIHMSDALKFIPYGIIVDEFQHLIYANPNASAQERNTFFRELEKKYLPHRIYADAPLLEDGCFWFRQGHIFQLPFYYIDYTLAQICALQFWKKMNHDRTSAWQDYLNICKIGGLKSFLGIVQLGQLLSPFDNGCVENIIGEIDNYLSSINDKEFN